MGGKEEKEPPVIKHVDTSYSGLLHPVFTLQYVISPKNRLYALKDAVKSSKI